MSSELLRKFSQNLQNTRIEKGIDLQQIHYKTRIDIKFLQAIEEGNFEILPDVFIRAFIKGYAKNIELDEDKVLQDYQNAKDGKSIVADIAPQEAVVETDDEVAKPEIKKEFVSEVTHAPVQNESKNNSKNIMTIGGAVLLIALIAVVYFFFIHEDTPEIITEKPFENVLQSEQQRFKEEKITPPVQEKVVEQDLKLKIAVTDSSWINVLIDNKDQEEFILGPGMEKELIGKMNFKLLIGNSGAVTIFLNDVKQNFTGRRGKVRNILVDTTGVKYLRINTSAKKTNE